MSMIQLVIIYANSIEVIKIQFFSFSNCLHRKYSRRIGETFACMCEFMTRFAFVSFYYVF